LGISRRYFSGHEDLPIGHWRFSGAKLKEIGELCEISGSGLNRYCDRLESRLAEDRHLVEELLRVVEYLK